MTQSFQATPFYNSYRLLEGHGLGRAIWFVKGCYGDICVGHPRDHLVRVAPLETRGPTPVRVFRHRDPAKEKSSAAAVLRLPLVSEPATSFDVRLLNLCGIDRPGDCSGLLKFERQDYASYT